MGVSVLLSALLALVFPDIFGLLEPTLINPLLGVIMFGMGLTLKPEDLRVEFSIWHNISGAIVARIYSKHEEK